MIFISFARFWNTYHLDTCNPTVYLADLGWFPARPSIGVHRYGFTVSPPVIPIEEEENHD